MAKLKILFVLFALIFTSVTPVNALEKPYFTSNTVLVEGLETWGAQNQPLDFVRTFFNKSLQSDSPVDWFLRYDAIESATISAYFKQTISTSSASTISLDLSLTPKLINKLGFANKENLGFAGLSTAERKSTIDYLVDNFVKRIGYFPKLIRSCYLDANSIEYLQKKYTTIGVVHCSEITDEAITISGGYINGPYFPSKLNTLVPSQSKSDRINTVVFPTSTTSYTDNLSSLADKVSQFSPADSNEFSFINFVFSNKQFDQSQGSSLDKYFQTIKTIIPKYQLKQVPLRQVADFVLTHYPESSPTYYYQTDDLKGFLYQNPYYRAIIKADDTKTLFTDLRIYNKQTADDYLLQKSQQNYLSSIVPNQIPQDKPLRLDFDLKNSSSTLQFWRIKLTNGTKTIEFTPKIISISQPIDFLPTSSMIRLDQHQDSTDIVIDDSKLIQNSLGLPIILSLILVSFLVTKRKPSLFIGLLFFLIPLLLVVFNGALTPYGLSFWGPNGHDAIFHLSIIDSLKNFPSLLSPTLSGYRLANYHFASDFVARIFAIITGRNNLEIFFSIVPVLVGLLLVFLTDKLMTIWKYSKLSKTIAFYFIFCAGSLGYLYTVISQHRVLAGDSVFWVNQSSSLLLNPPYFLSLVIIILFLTIYEKYIQRKKPSTFLILIVLAALLVQTKVYAFILIILALISSKQIKLAISILLLGAVITLPFYSPSIGAPFIFEPLWFIKTIFAASDRLFIPQIASIWQNSEWSASILKVVLLSILGSFIFLVGNFHYRLLFFKQKLDQASKTVVFFLIIYGVIIPFFFVQKANPWNSIQFTYYSLFFSGIFSAQIIANHLTSQKLRNKIFMLVTIVATTLPTTAGVLLEYISKTPSTMIQPTEVLALDYLSKQPDGLVVASAYDSSASNVLQSPKPLFAYTSTSYISAISHHPEFISDTINLDIMGYDYSQRQKDQQRLFNTNDPLWVKSFLSTNRITYLYQNYLNQIKFRPGEACLDKIYESGIIVIYKFQCNE